MRKQLLFVCPLLLIGTALWGAPTCTTASLSVYDASGFNCSLGGIMFSNFSFSNTSPPPTAAQVTVVPTTDSAGDVTLQFDGAFSAGAGESLSAAISYLASASSAIMTGESLAMTGFGQSGNGSVDIGESVCLGGAYSSTGQCGGSGVDSISVYDYSATDMRTFDSVSFSPAQSEIDVVKNIAINGGTTGTNASATVSEVFNTTMTSGGGGGTGGGPVPEPNTMVMMGSGLLVAALAWRRRCRA
jgi:PEP-CTERM motif